MQPEPDDALLRLQADNARIIERRHDRRLLLRAPVANNGLAGPEDVGGVQLLLPLPPS